MTMMERVQSETRPGMWDHCGMLMDYRNGGVWLDIKLHVLEKNTLYIQARRCKMQKRNC